MGTRDSAARGGQRDLLFQEQQIRFESSGKTIAAFCKDEGVPVSTFYQRRARLKKRLPKRSLSLAKRPAPFIDAGAVMVSAPTRAMMPHYPGREPIERVEVRIDLGGGVVLHVSRS